MRALLTGATGYIGQRLLARLLADGHHVICLVRDPARLHPIKSGTGTWEARRADLLDPASLRDLPPCDVAYYLVHSMSDSEDFAERERACARNFLEGLQGTGARQVIYLSGICNDPELSPHLASRRAVEEVLASSSIPLTVLRAAIIVGSGSASFEIIRDLVEKLPMMITPRWLETRCQPIAIRSVLEYLAQTMGNEGTFGKTFDIGGPDVLTYREMLLQFAEIRGVRRWIVPVPVLSPRLSSYWLYLVTSTSFSLARNLVDSMKAEVVCRDDAIDAVTDVEPVSYRKAVELAFMRIEQNEVVSSWKDAAISSNLDVELSAAVQPPRFGCLTDERSVAVAAEEVDRVVDNIFSIGGRRGWYYADFLWELRGFIDKLVGGVGLRRGRRDPHVVRPGEVLDFWRVLVADREERRLLLFAEMKLPGEAWLELRVDALPDGGFALRQTATFRPRGVLGRLYWYGIMPVHVPIFRGMARRIAGYRARGGGLRGGLRKRRSRPARVTT